MNIKLCSHVNMTLAERLAHNLKKRRGGMTQEQFAKKLGISRATLTRLENAAQNTTLQTIEQISKSCKCDVGELFRV